MPSEYKLTLQCDSHECDTLYAFIERSLLADERHRPDVEVINDLKLVAEEWFANVLNHGYRHSGTGNLELTLAVEDTRIELTFRDSAPPFNPLQPGSAQDRDPAEGGMGLTLIRSLTDDRAYKREGEHNVFTLTKHYNPV